MTECPRAQVAPQVVLDVAGAIPPSAVLELIAACESGSFKELQSAMTDLIADGYPVRTCKGKTVGLSSKSIIADALVLRLAF